MSKKVTYKDFLILQSIPQKGKISTTEIIHKLNNQGFEITPRTVQRDLNNLAEFFEIKSDNNPDTPGWFWQSEAVKIELPMMSPDVALSFKMTQNYLQHFLPKSVINELNPYFSSADKVLQNVDNSLSNWSKKVGTTSRRVAFVAPKIKPDILENIYKALLENKQIKASYKPIIKSKTEYILHPQGLVVVDEVLYLVASVWDYKDLRQFSLHRFKKVEILDESCKKSAKFNIKSYIKSGNFLFPKGQKNTEVVLQINDYLAEYLSESKLNISQKIIKTNENENVLTAKVQISEQFRWWILSMGDGVKVISPDSLKNEIISTITKSYKKYNE
jgi:predicted DNA-binding transcriptional regulator YafY